MSIDLHKVERAGVFRLDANRRLDVRFARIEQAEEALAYEETLGGRTPWSAQLREDIERLRPYWGPGVTFEQAAAAWWAARSPREGTFPRLADLAGEVE
jgi:hypothetical protein